MPLKTWRVIDERGLTLLCETPEGRPRAVDTLRGYLCIQHYVEPYGDGAIRLWRPTRAGTTSVLVTTDPWALVPTLWSCSLKVYGQLEWWVPLLKLFKGEERPCQGRTLQRQGQLSGRPGLRQPFPEEFSNYQNRQKNSESKDCRLLYPGDTHPAS